MYYNNDGLDRIFFVFSKFDGGGLISSIYQTYFSPITIEIHGIKNHNYIRRSNKYPTRV